MQKWEYLVVVWDKLYSVTYDQTQKYINGLGEDGWELVSVTAFHNTSGNIGTSDAFLGMPNIYGSISTNMYCKMIFKRPKP